MKDDVLVVLDDYVIFHIVAPYKKVYFQAFDDSRLFCTSNKYSATKFVNRFSALDKIEKLKNYFNLDFSIERL